MTIDTHVVWQPHFSKKSNSEMLTWTMFKRGSITMEPGYRPKIEALVLKKETIEAVIPQFSSRMDLCVFP